MFNTALACATIRNFQKNLKKSIDKENQKVYNNNEDKERGADKMQELTIINIINLIMENKIQTSQLFFYVENIGFLQVDEIYFYSNGIIIHNCTLDEKQEFLFTDKIFVKD